MPEPARSPSNRNGLMLATAWGLCISVALIGTLVTIKSFASAEEARARVTGTEVIYATYAQKLVDAEAKVQSARKAVTSAESEVARTRMELDAFIDRVLPHYQNKAKTGIYRLWNTISEQGDLDTDHPFQDFLNARTSAQRAEQLVLTAQEDLLVPQVTEAGSAGALRSVKKELIEAESNVLTVMIVAGTLLASTVIGASLLTIYARRRSR